MNDIRPYAYICLWEYKAPEKIKKGRSNKFWHLVECYGVDQDGYACTESKHASDDRHSYDKWMQREVWYNETTKEVSDTPIPGQDEEDSDWESIMGRAVTVWTTEYGVGLAAFTPPEWTPWLGSEFYENLKKSRQWYAFLEDGYTLFAGTARAVEKMIFSDTKPDTPV